MRLGMEVSLCAGGLVHARRGEATPEANGIRIRQADCEARGGSAQPWPIRRESGWVRQAEQHFFAECAGYRDAVAARGLELPLRQGA